MLERLVLQERALVQILGADPKTTHLNPRWQDTELMESIFSALKPISDLTDILSGEEHVTASCLKPLLDHMHNETFAEKEGDTTLEYDIQQRIKQYMKRKYEDESVMSTLNIYSCLDTRFMLKYCNDDETIAIRQSIIQKGLIIARQIEEQQPPCPLADSENERQEKFTGPSAAPSTKKKRLVDILCSAVCTTNSTQQAMSNEEHVKEELSCYLGYNQPEINTNPSEWWKHHSKDLLYLSTLSKKYLSVCATSSLSERVLSTSGNIITAKCNLTK